MKARGALIAAALLVLGIVPRLLVVGLRGGEDMDSYITWGSEVAGEGIFNAYHGIYFPLQYQIFGGLASLAASTHHSPYLVFKLANLAAELVILPVLARLLALWRVSPMWVFAYWLNPYFIVSFAQGYVDFQLALLVVVAVWLVTETRTAPIGYVLAGCAIAIAAMMKPQAIELVVVVALYIAARAIRPAFFRWWAMPNSIALPTHVRTGLLHVPVVILPALLFAGYSVYFGVNGYATNYLLETYQKTSSVFPALTAHMLNIWYPIAFVLRKPNQEIWAIMGPAYLHAVGLAIAAIAMVVAVVAIAKWHPADSIVPPLYSLFFASATIVPMLYTQAHENHLFLALVLAVPAIAFFKDRWIRASLVVATLVQALNLFLLYGLGLDRAVTGGAMAVLESLYHYRVRLLADLLMLAVTATATIRIAALAAGSHEPARQGRHVFVAEAPERT